MIYELVRFFLIFLSLLLDFFAISAFSSLFFTPSLYKAKLASHFEQLFTGGNDFMQIWHVINTIRSVSN